eukprot:CAMPEP_0113725008 /NCGR_PEP_ID=MMETSP0038_2-20120614/39463_1 /TAXON_ID=2898 /ORGANISM="Cryptomonas paramecium" /LENGTH=400 /DNA_ID=CAMNT_0000655107 /DNA_START=47 /DNA_END=1245 /DNA_ORIENTATION=- /assembly_acc=CAM_ASM_000170
MSLRLTAPARSPLRRLSITSRGGDGSPLFKANKSPPRIFRRKQSLVDDSTADSESSSKIKGNRSPVRFVRNKQQPDESVDADAEALRLQAEACLEGDYDVIHLRPSLQRFWKRSEQFSPRSRRLSKFIVGPKNEDDATIAKLHHVRESVADTIEQTKKILQLTSSFLVAHFESIPSHELSATIQFVFSGFDKNGDGHLDAGELSEAFACMGKRLTADELSVLLKEYDTDKNFVFDLHEFDSMVRAALNRPADHLPQRGSDELPAAPAATAKSLPSRRTSTLRPATSSSAATATSTPRAAPPGSADGYECDAIAQLASPERRPSRPAGAVSFESPATPRDHVSSLGPRVPSSALRPPATAATAATTTSGGSRARASLRNLTTLAVSDPAPPSSSRRGDAPA